MKKAPANAAIVLKLLPRYYPDAHCALDHKNAFELLIATILSAQCTDERVNIVTKGLFAKYPTPEKMAKAKQEDLEELIRSAGFYKNKAKNIKACAQALVEKHQGQVPDKMDELVELAGVGRKTANVVLGNAFDIASGIVVDTHVTRLSNRLGWVKGEDAVAIEKRLCEFVPKDHWIKLSHELIFHGRQICKARKPLCERCFLLEHCPQKGV
ncbi:MAG: endonuclease III [Bdellovibrionales bacterium]|nr:endonuclease III [Bdellovibrionales bacterium]